MRHAYAAWIPAFIFLMLLWTAPVAAQATLMVGPSRITADQPLIPGQSYALPTYTVTNGSEQEFKVKVSFSDYPDETRKQPPVEWFTFSPAEFVVSAGSSGTAQAKVVLPQDAPAGAYRAWFLFEAVPVEAKGVVVAPAIRVSFVFDISAAKPVEPTEASQQTTKPPAEETANGKNSGGNEATASGPRPKEPETTAATGGKQPIRPPWIALSAGGAVLALGGWLLRHRLHPGGR